VNQPGVNDSGGEQARERISQAQGRRSQGAKESGANEPGVNKSEGEPAKGRKSQTPRVSLYEHKTATNWKVGHRVEEKNNKVYSVEHCSLWCKDMDNDAGR